jgi:hypothetical protein
MNGEKSPKLWGDGIAKKLIEISRYPSLPWCLSAASI